MSESLSWDASYAIARALMAKFPQADLEAVALDDIFRWTTELAEFDDEPELANEEVLLDIFNLWLEETQENLHEQIRFPRNEI